MKRLKKFGRCTHKDNAGITLNKLFSSDMMSQINLKGHSKEIIITEQKYETFTKVQKMQLQRSCQNYFE